VIAGAVAKRYAKALADAAADTGALEAVGAELDTFATLWHEQAAMARFFVNPGVLLRDKAQALQNLTRKMQLSLLLARFLDLLLSRERMQALPAVAHIYGELMNKRLGRIQATATTAVPLAPKLAERLRRRMDEVLEESVLLETRVDPAILGGVVVQVDSTVYDGSLRTQLRHLREHLLRE